MPFSVTTLMREPGIFGSVSICVLILEVSQVSFWRARKPEGGRICSSLWTVFTR
ncbi:hypothetical protein D3C81_2173410 [compost metagenome]